jgi:hypothetical protein
MIKTENYFTFLKKEKQNPPRAASFLPLSFSAQPDAARAAHAHPRSSLSRSRARPAFLRSAQQRLDGPLARARALPDADTPAPHVIPYLPLFPPVAVARRPAGDHDLGSLIRPNQHGLLPPANSLHHSTTKPKHR